MTAVPGLFHLDLPSSGNPRLVLLHGLGMGHRMWTPQLEGLAGLFHIIAPDLPGLARSKDSGPFSIRESASAIGALIRETGDDRVHIVGLSLGAMVGLQLALDVGPDRIGSLLISGGQVRPSLLLSGLQRVVFSLMPESRVVEMMASSIPSSDTQIRAAAREDAKLTKKDGFLEAVKSASRVDFRSSLSDVGVRTTVACGANDRPNLPASAEMAARIPDARLEVISEAGHVWNLEKPERFNRLVRETVRVASSGD